MMSKLAKTVEDAEAMAKASGVVGAGAVWPPPASEWTVGGKSVAHVAQYIGYANTDQGKADPRREEAAIYFRGLATGKSPDRADNMTDLRGTEDGNKLLEWEHNPNPKADDPFHKKLRWLREHHPGLCDGLAAKFFSRQNIERGGGAGVGDEGYEPFLVDGKEVRVIDQILYTKPLELAQAEEREQASEQRQAEGLAFQPVNEPSFSVEAVAQGARNPLSEFAALAGDRIAR